jgi:NADH:ubiquinone oxidoreductase subunit F (NADH-binding)
MSNTLVQLARRRAVVRDERTTAIDDLHGGRSVADTAARRGLPEVAVRGVRSFYDFLRIHDDGTPRPCVGTACAFAGGSAPPSRGTPAPTSTHTPLHVVHCVGRCYEAPSELTAEDGTDAGTPVPRRSLVQPPVVFRHLLGSEPSLHDLYAVPEPDTILDILDAADLRGRGGAAFRTAAKWRAARAAHGTPVHGPHGANKYVVANGDEGDPGSFVDRLLLEEDPHAILAGMQACAVAIGASHAIVYVRAEYPWAATLMRTAIAEAENAGVVFPGLRFEVHVGAGSYVCGEETALLRAIEGQRAEPSPKPPYPTEQGLFGRPTVVQNVETLAIIPELLRTGRRSSTKAFSVSGAVNAPGAVEAELGITLQKLIDDGAGGIPTGRTAKMALVGGPMGRVVPASRFDTALGYDTFSGLGHGGIVVLDDSVSARDLAAHLFAFAASESCGSCTPCRVGTALLHTRTDVEGLLRLLDTLEMGSLCGFGQGVPRPIRDLLEHFPDELFPLSSASNTGGGQ